MHSTMSPNASGYVPLPVFYKIAVSPNTHVSVADNLIWSMTSKGGYEWIAFSRSSCVFIPLFIWCRYFWRRHQSFQINNTTTIARCDPSLLRAILIEMPISGLCPIKTRHYSYIANSQISWLFRMLKQKARFKTRVRIPSGSPCQTTWWKFIKLFLF